MEMAPREGVLPGTRPTERKQPVDTQKSSAPLTLPSADNHDELLAAACEAIRLLQDRQAHVPEEMLDPRERRVLRQLRSAVRQSVSEGEEV
jgi:hypothetical protein